MKDILTVSEKTFAAMPVIDTSVALCVYGITDIAPVKEKLLGIYGDVTVTADGKTAMLSELGSAECVEIDAQPLFSKLRYNVVDAVRVTERLTQKDGGCPWDKAQTHESIRINMIEEAYEAVDAIDKRDAENMCEEFGDVLLQSLLQSDISRRSGEFGFGDVCDGLCKKLIGRHSFIFGDDSAANADEALSVWEKNKGIEKHYDSVGTQLRKLPENFPALLLCEKVYKKRKKAGLIITAPADELKTALDKNDYARVIAACAALLADSGADAEVELNKLNKSVIDSL